MHVSSIISVYIICIIYINYTYVIHIVCFICLLGLWLLPSCELGISHPIRGKAPIPAWQIDKAVLLHPAVGLLADHPQESRKNWWKTKKITDYDNPVSDATTICLELFDCWAFRIAFISVSTTWQLKPSSRDKNTIQASFLVRLVIFWLWFLISYKPWEPCYCPSSHPIHMPKPHHADGNIQSTQWMLFTPFCTLMTSHCMRWTSYTVYYIETRITRKLA